MRSKTTKIRQERLVRFRQKHGLSEKLPALGLNPLIRQQSPKSWLNSSVYLGGAVLFHALVFGGLAQGAREQRDEKRHEVIQMAVVEKKPEPVKPEILPEAAKPETKTPIKPKPKPKRVKKKNPPRRVVKKAPPPPTAAEPPKAPKKVPRIVGISMGSTVQGGSGPAFAIGNSRYGVTEKTAQKAVNEAPTEEGPKKMVKRNRVASRIPVAGVKMERPKRKKVIRPAYPEQYRSQGIEGKVTVELSIDSKGKVKKVRLVAPSQYQAFNDSAKKTAFLEDFEPALRDGEPVKYTLVFTYRFLINS